MTRSKRRGGNSKGKASLMSRPYKRNCDSCGKEFMSRSNGRVYCHKCSPPQVSGAGRKDDRPGGMGLDRVGNCRERDDMKSANPPEPEPDPSPDPKKPMIDVTLEAMSDQISGQPGPVMKHGRPKEGWGKCRHINPKTGKEICDAEKWSDVVPFCPEHVKFWNEKRKERLVRKLIEDEVDQLSELRVKDFSFKTPQAAADFLGKVNYAVFKNWLTVSKARALKEIVLAQVKALDSMILAKKIEALLELKQAGGKPDDFSFDPRELEEDVTRAKDMGLTELTTVLDAKKTGS